MYVWALTTKSVLFGVCNLTFRFFVFYIFIFKKTKRSPARRPMVSLQKNGIYSDLKRKKEEGEKEKQISYR